MATITARRRKSGVRYTAQIRINRNGRTVYTESETFDKKPLAKQWAAKREAELSGPGALQAAQHRGISIGQVLEWYRDDFNGLTKFGRSKLSHINFMINSMDLAQLDAIEVTSAQLVSHAYQRRKGGAGPSTVNNDMVWLRNAFRAIRVSKNIPCNLQAVDDAAYLCRKENVISKSATRDRRPTLGELDALLAHFQQSGARSRRAAMPMVDIVLMALFSSRRQGEICGIQWADLDERKHRVLVRDMKHPTKKIDTWVFLPDPAWSMVERQPQLDGESRIFPFNPNSVSSAFTRACHFLDIEDLCFHDLRHECTSHLFELEWGIPKVAGVTGHRSWTSLQRYTHLSEGGYFDKYDGWGWRP